jgi:hypothetical protein
MPYQDFDAVRRERQRAFEPIQFVLAGKRFTCIAHPTLADSFELLDAPELRDDQGAPIAAGVRALAEFIERSIATPREQRAFRRLLGRRDDPIDALTVIELGEWLAEQYSGRPTVRPSDSSDGSLTPGPTSNTSPSVADGLSVN